MPWWDFATNLFSDEPAATDTTTPEPVSTRDAATERSQEEAASQQQFLESQKDPTATQDFPAQSSTTQSTQPDSTRRLTSPTVSSSKNIDRRARLRPKPGAESYVYGDATSTGLLSILRETNGLLFPSTPTINETHAVQYSSYSPTHSIAKFNSYERTDNVNIQISGDFNVTNATEARYLLACIHFLRSVTKMDFGATSQHAGTPPPVLLFSAYGNFMYNDIPVIIKGVNFTLEQDVDYIQVPIFGTSTDFGRDLLKVPDFYKIDTDKPERVWVPSRLTISLTLEQQTTGEWLINQFNLDSFKRGDLLTNGGII